MAGMRLKRDKRLVVRPVPVESLRLEGTRVAVVGGTGGIGRALSLRLAARGAHVIVVGRTFRDRSVRGIEFLEADLSLLGEAGRIGDALPAETLDLVVFTTGIMAGPKREVTSEGIERDLAVSYLSRFVIVDRIGERLGRNRARPGMRVRMFVVGFPGSNQVAAVDDLNSERRYGRIRAHSNTVAGNEALVLDAAERFPQVDTFGLNPGFVETDIRGNFFKSRAMLAMVEWLTAFMTLKPGAYADRIAPLLVSPDLDGRSGAMFDNKARAILPSAKLLRPGYAKALIAASRNLVSGHRG
ncbi:SDR family NAD(P)-dependent oxidoreductase [Methylobacterium sp. NI91]|nr:SDR family NAD(P)-dependent oxidoreductase [Methylobacterium sp. CLZ]QIJ80916.1 SDR family NAD(P)-dependent oxidoreductase [Methylobacterium sp. NI91]